MKTAAFLDALYGNCTGGFIELRSLPSGRRVWTELGRWHELGPFVTREAPASTVALGIATRRTTANGCSTNLQELPALWTDYDGPPRDFEQRLAKFLLQPGIITSTGGGAHGYWLLKEPAILTDTGTFATVSSLLRRLAGLFRGDDAACDPARVLRLVNTLNVKFQPPRPVHVIRTATTSFTLSDFDELLPREVTREHERVNEGLIPKGRREHTLFSIGRSMRWHGIRFDRLSWTLRELNATECVPPFTDDELRALLHRILTAPDKPGFQKNPVVGVGG